MRNKVKGCLGEAKSGSSPQLQKDHMGYFLVEGTSLPLAATKLLGVQKESYV